MKTIQLKQDGNRVCALLGEDIQSGIAGFAESEPDALRALAYEIEMQNPAFAKAQEALSVCHTCGGSGSVPR